LQGRNMERYYLSPEQFDDFFHRVVQLSDDTLLSTGAAGESHHGYITGGDVCDEDVLYPTTVSDQALQCASPYVVGAREAILRDLRHKHQSVQMLDSLSNEAYDALLSENVVFLNLLDASAVNTLLECIVRNTPVLVNALPAVLEYLGQDYPLYYRSLDEAGALLRRPSNIVRAHFYLKRLDKHRLRIEHFVSKLIETVWSE